MPSMRVRNIDPRPMTGKIGSRTITIPPGGAHEFPDLCSAIQFLNSVPQGGMVDNTGGEATEQANRVAEAQGCAERLRPVAVPATDGPGQGVVGPSDTPQQQQAPDLQPAATVETQPSPLGAEPGDARQPTEVLHDRQNPQTRGQVKDGVISQGATEQQADEAVDRAEKGNPPAKEPRVTHSGNQGQQQSQDGEPVDLYSGVLRMFSVDLDVPTPFLPLQLQRRYQSGRPYYGPWGFNWDHNWNVFLRELNNGDIARWNGCLHEDLFRNTGPGFEPPRGVFELLERSSDGARDYTITAPSGIKARFQQPPAWTDAERIPLLSVTDRAGNTIQLKYDASSRLESVVDGDGRGLFFTYGDCGFLEQVRDHSNRRVQYFHDEQREHLMAVSLPATDDFPAGLNTRYEYITPDVHIAMVHNLIRVIDQEGNTVLQNFYGDDPADISFNRVVRQIVGGYFYAFTYRQLQWLPNDPLYANDSTLQTTVLHPDNSLWTFTFNSAGELLDERFRLNHDGSFRVVIRKRQYDSQGNLVRQAEPDGSATIRTYDDANPDPRNRGNLLRVERTASPIIPVASRIIFRAEYEPRFQLLRRMISENGAVTRVFYDFDISPSPANKGVLDRIEWPDATLPDRSTQSSVTHFESNARGQTTAAITPEGHRDELIYEPAGSPKAGFLREYHADAAGVNETWKFDYDAIGYLRQRIEPGGALRVLRYNALGNLQKEEFPAINGVVDSISYRYNSQTLPAEIRSPRGEFSDAVITGNEVVEKIKTNPLGHVVERILGANTATPKRFTYEPDFRGRAIFSRDAGGVVTRTCYDERGLLLFETAGYQTPQERTTRYIYNLAGQLIKQIDPGERVTEFKYDAWGRISETKLPNGTRIQSTWNEFDLPLVQEVIGSPGGGLPDRVLRRIVYEYDERGRRIRQRLAAFENDPASAVEITEIKWHNRDGRCVRREGPRGAIWQFEYDGRSRLFRETDPLNNVRTTTFDSAGLPARVSFEDTGPGGPVTRFIDHEHDARKRLIRTVTSSGQENITRYDARDLPVEKRNEAGVTSLQRFGLHGELLETIQDPTGLNLSYRYSYDASARSISFTDPMGEVTLTDRDVLGRVIGLRLADGSHYIRTFDAAGDLTRINSAEGSLLTMTYDGAGRIVSLMAVPGVGRLPVPTHQFAYDGVDRLVRAEAGGAVVERKFDSLDRLIEDTFAGRVFQREYDDRNGSYRLKYPDGRLEEYRWDLLGRVDEIRLVKKGESAVASASGSPGSLLLSARYRGSDRIGRLVHGNGVQSEWRHDLEGRVIRVEHSRSADSLAAVRYRYDLANRRRAIQNSNPAQQNSVADYDSRGRLTRFRLDFALPLMADNVTQPQQNADIAAAVEAAAGATQSTSFVLDGSDTRTSVDGTAYTSVVGHKVIQVGPDALTYDADGARTSDASRNYSYDALGRLVRINVGASTWEYEFDPLGRRIRTLSPTKDERRFYFHGHALQLEDAAGVVTAQRTAHPQLLNHSVETRVDGPLHFHLNGHEDLILVTNSAGNVAERYLYGPFGSPTIIDAAGAPLANSALAIDPTFGGMPYLSAAGLYFTPKRHYDPATGLFLARDPFFFLVSPSPYVFALHDPINHLDPVGNIAPLIVAGLVVGAIGAVVGAASVIIKGGDYDGWDVLAAAGIGFGAGFIGGVTFGWASGAIGGAALTGAAATTATAGAAASGGVSILSGIGAGAVSGLASGVFSGSARATYQWIRHGGDLGSMVVQGAVEEGISGTVAGAVGGGLFQGALRIGVVPPNAWAALRGASAATSHAAVLPATLGRAALGAYGLGSAAIGFSSAYAGGVTRRLLQGESLDDAVDNAVTDGLWGAGASVAATALHPTSWVYWRSRVSQSYAQRIQDMRSGAAHHQRNVAQYPEFATPDLTQGGQLTPTPFEQFYGRYIIGGNLDGQFSTYSNRQQHIALHNLWRFGQTGSPWNVSSHGPWTPAWNVHNLPADPRSTNNVDKEN